MSTPISSLARGRSFVRSVIARAVAGESGAAEFAAGRWGSATNIQLKSRAERLVAKRALSGDETTDPELASLVRLKAAVATIGSAELAAVADPGADEFFATVLQASIIGRLVGRREVGFEQRLLRMTSGSRGFWVSQAKPKPISKPAVEGSKLAALKIAAIIVAPDDALKVAAPDTEARFQADLTRAVAEVLDTSFIDPANAGTLAEEPASITNGVTPIASAGDPATDVAALIAAFTGDLSAAYFITDPTTATQIALARDAGGSFAFPDCGPRGGSILGIPLITSRSSPRDSSGGQLALVDPSAIAIAAAGVEIDRSRQATLQMSDTPDDPLDANTVLVSLWHHNLVALKAEIYANWEVQRTGAVAYVADALYPVSVTP